MDDGKHEGEGEDACFRILFKEVCRRLGMCVLDEDDDEKEECPAITTIKSKQAVMGGVMMGGVMERLFCSLHPPLLK